MGRERGPLSTFSQDIPLCNTHEAGGRVRSASHFSRTHLKGEGAAMIRGPTRPGDHR